MLSRSARALPVLLVALALPASAPAATVVGSDLSGTPSVSCVTGGANAFNECTLTQLEAAGYAAPLTGVITGWRIKHGAELGATIPAAELRILSAGGAARTFTARRADAQVSLLSESAGVDSFAFSDDFNRPRGVPIAQGERIGVYVNDASLPVAAAAAGQVGFVLGSHAGGALSYGPVAGSLLLQAVIEPDVDRDGYGDESQDGCLTGAGPAACPGAGDDGGGGSRGGGAATIEEFHAESIAVYRAATIKRLPRRANLYDAVMRGFSQPIRCSLTCRITTAATMRGISASLYAMMTRSARSVEVAKGTGRFPSAGTGKLRVKLRAKARKALRRVRHDVKVTLRTTVKDARRTVTRTQTITLKAARR